VIVVADEVLAGKDNDPLYDLVAKFDTSSYVALKLGISAATKLRNAGCALPPETGPANTELAD
jgi:hypothetical protein